MRPSRVRSMVADHLTVVNAWVATGSGYLVETLAHAGFDCVTLDFQHGMFGLDSAVPLLQALSAGPAEPFVRPPSLDPAVIGHLLDAGAYGVICPNIDTPAQARALVDACGYPPSGHRSYGPARGLLYGGADYVAQADRTVTAWAMVESAAALDAVHQIAATPGLFGLYVGPNDLAMSLSLEPGQNPAPAEIERAWVRVLEAAHAAGIAAGTFCPDAEVARRLSALGYDLVTPGNDIMLLGAAVGAALHTVRGT